MTEQRRLLSGYTTGTCAQAAAKAAAECLLTGIRLTEVTVILPGGQRAKFQPEKWEIRRGEVTCAVKKYSGDDPDVTNGVYVYASVRRCEKEGIWIDGGLGVGRVTKPGLDQTVGAAAINRVPREMISKTAQEVLERSGLPGGLKVIISIPEGVKLAARTFNPRLGIEGGISVLGTTGIVEPMSEKALIDTIQVEINVRRAEGRRWLIAAPGNYGLTFLEETYHIPGEQAVKCSNYVGETIDMAAVSGAEGLVFAAHIGKFIKVAAGIMNTHSRYADGRAEVAASAMLRAGLSTEKARAMLDCVTTDEMLAMLDGEEKKKFLSVLFERIGFHLQNRAGEMKCGAVLFSNQQGMLGMTEGTEAFLRAAALETHLQEKANIDLQKTAERMKEQHE